MKTVKKNNLYGEIKNILQQARETACRAVNFTMVMAYWEIGKRIVEEEQQGKKRAGYGEALIKELSKRLTADFGKGFDERELRKIRQLYLLFSIRDPASPELLKEQLKKRQTGVSSVFSKIYALRRELSWTHYRLLMRVEDPAARTWYMNEAADSNWSTRSLERQINTFTYQRILSSKNKKAVKKEADQKIEKSSPLDFIKDPYVLEFLHLPAHNNFYEKDIEAAIISKLQQFILELGKGFSFVARQKRISAEDDHFYVDLVFYNYILKCFVLIDLKLGKLTHQDIGQMDLYVRYWEDNEKTATDNPTIGIILCSQKNETIVKYSVLKESQQLFASKYKLYLPTEEELKHEVREEIIRYNQYHSK
ncbi:PDDEXK nuclease domain-containing protein [Ferruginibacter sp. SUN106]|uniref:PDDEXK nuclease domain-containing protein n=1 Tax=Ferruginibacter sp. SUN106 TaxID=2978348 RepID=UPI003D35AA98